MDFAVLQEWQYILRRQVLCGQAQCEIERRFGRMECTDSWKPENCKSGPCLGYPGAWESDRRVEDTVCKRGKCLTHGDACVHMTLLMSWMINNKMPYTTESRWKHLTQTFELFPIIAHNRLDPTTLSSGRPPCIMHVLTQDQWLLGGCMDVYEHGTTCHTKRDDFLELFFIRPLTPPLRTCVHRRSKGLIVIQVSHWTLVNYPTPHLLH